MLCTAAGVAVLSGIGRGAVLDGMPSSVAQAVYRRLVRLLYCVRWNGENQRKSFCKAL
nr:MAG TPA: anticodon binding domain protein [Caudoviricetes sp.]